MNRIVEIILQSGLLILIVLAARALVKNRISARAIYVLWLVPMVRLLLPVSVSSPLSIMNLFVTSGEAVNAVSSTDTVMPAAAPATLVPLTEPAVQAVQKMAPTQSADAAAAHLGLTDILLIVWLVGAALTLAYMIAANIRYLRALMANAHEMTVDVVLPKRTRVYVSPAAASPCVWGLWKRRIVLTAPCVDDACVMAYALKHEMAHIRQRDTLIALLRMLLCAAYWFNPLVWLSARLCRDDSELSCDERVMEGLDINERIKYGHVLIGLLAKTTTRLPIGSTATTMRGGSNMKKRIERIAHARKPSKAAAVVMAGLMIAFMLISCTSTDDTTPNTMPDTIPTDTASVSTDDGHVDAPEQVAQTVSEYATIVRDYTRGYMPTMSSLRGLPIVFSMDNIDTVTLTCAHGAFISELNDDEGACSITLDGEDIAGTEDEWGWSVYWVPFNTAGTVENIRSDVISAEATDTDGNRYHQTLCVLLDQVYTMFDMPDADNAALSTPATIMVKKDDTMTAIQPSDPYYAEMASFATQRIAAVDSAERAELDVLNREVAEWKQTYDWIELYYPEKYLAGEFVGTGDSQMELMAHTRLLMFLSGEYADVLFPYNETEGCYVAPVFLGKPGAVPDVGFDTSLQSNAVQDDMHITMYAYTAEAGGVRYIYVRAAIENTGADAVTLDTAPYITLNVAQDGTPVADYIGEQFTSYRGTIAPGDTLDVAVTAVEASQGGTYTLGGQFGDLALPDLDVAID